QPDGNSQSRSCWNCARSDSLPSTCSSAALVPRILKGRTNLLAYLVILLITFAGMMQVHWSAAVAGGCILVLLPLVETSTGVRESDARRLALINGASAASAAFVLGRATGWLWGI